MPGKIGAPKTEDGRWNRERILDFLQDYKREHGYYPTRDEMCAALELSTGAMTWHITSLASQGYLSYEPGRLSRTLKLTRKQRKFLE